MKRLALAGLMTLLVALPAAAQVDPQPAPPEPPAPQPTAPPPAPEQPKSNWATSKWFFGGGFGVSFGTVDAITVAPMIGLRVHPRVSVGTQPYYRWVNDDNYPSSTDEYGATLFVRFQVWRSLFLEGDYQYTNYEYFNTLTSTQRANYNAFLAGGGYAIPMGRNAAMYVSALYDFSYDDNDLTLPYSSPWRVSVGATVGF